MYARNYTTQSSVIGTSAVVRKVSYECEIINLPQNRTKVTSRPAFVDEILTDVKDGTFIGLNASRFSFSDKLFSYAIAVTFMGLFITGGLIFGF